jgi:hypothetical protein
MSKQTTTKQTAYFVQAQLGDQFEDLIIKAKTPAEAIAKARKATRLQHRFTAFVI